MAIYILTCGSLSCGYVVAMFCETHCACIPLVLGCSVCNAPLRDVRAALCVRVPAFVVTWLSCVATCQVGWLSCVVVLSCDPFNQLFCLFLRKLLNCGCPVILASREKIVFPTHPYPRAFSFFPLPSPILSSLTLPLC